RRGPHDVAGARHRQLGDRAAAPDRSPPWRAARTRGPTDALQMRPNPSPIYQPCSQCGAPLDDRQRFCVECGASRGHPSDPVTRHFTAVTRYAIPDPASVAPPPRRGVDTRLTALILALLPAAAAL